MHFSVLHDSDPTASAVPSAGRERLSIL